MYGVFDIDISVRFDIDINFDKNQSFSFMTVDDLFIELTVFISITAAPEKMLSCSMH